MSQPAPPKEPAASSRPPASQQSRSAAPSSDSSDRTTKGPSERARSVPPHARTFHRELSWLRFNERVLEEAQDTRLPAAERARFLSIASSNLDEFVMVRFPTLFDGSDAAVVGSSGLTRSGALAAVRRNLRRHVADIYNTYDRLLPTLEALGVQLVPRDAWSTAESRRVEFYFQRSLELILTPLAVDPAHPFPLLANLRLYLALELQTEGSQETSFALVGVPSTEPRLFALSEGRYALLEDAVGHAVADLFPGSAVLSSAPLRVTRDGSIDIDEDQTTDLLVEIEEGLRHRGRGAVVRLEVAACMSARMRAWLISNIGLDEQDVLEISGPIDPGFLGAASSLTPALSEAQFSPHRPASCPAPWDDPFSSLRERSLLLHHPYDSFEPVVHFVEKAARDPQVVAIKQTLYRVSGDSPIVQALIEAARSGKQVTVLCELKARFDESRNIGWARRLERAGAHVLYGVIGYKVHAKLLLIVRHDEDGVRRYVHLGTGNYNDTTARFYEDLSYFTANEAVCRDVGRLFNMLTGFSRPPAWERLVVAPLTFRSTIEAWIEREVEHARKGRVARIFCKCNSLVDTEVCERLYAASQAGVQIDLVIRGVCILRPGVPGLSDNIRVRSVVGRFLEHSRIYRFENRGSPTYLFGSGDWMTRNFDWRVESLAQLLEPEFQGYLDHVIEGYLSDCRNTRVLQADGTYRHLGMACDEVGIQNLLIAERHEERRPTSGGETLTAFRPARAPSA